jgi:hypothetical protein
VFDAHTGFDPIGQVAPVWHAAPPPPRKPPPEQQSEPVPHSVGDEQTCIDPIGQVAWHVVAPPPPRPPAQHTSPLGHPAALAHRQVMVPPKPPQVWPVGQLLPPPALGMQSWLAPAGQEAMHVDTVPAPMPPSPLGERQQAPLVQDVAVHPVTVIVPEGHAAALVAHE